MKKLQSLSLIAVLLLFTGFSLHAQTTTSGSSRNAVVRIKTSAECDMCKQHIEKEVNHLKGVKKAELDLSSRVLTVEYNPKKISPEDIRKAISNIGYDADDVKANNRASRQLSHSCPPKDSAQ